jgi:hypothetical protein
MNFYLNRIDDKFLLSVNNLVKEKIVSMLNYEEEMIKEFVNENGLYCPLCGRKWQIYYDSDSIQKIGCRHRDFNNIEWNRD